MTDQDNAAQAMNDDEFLALFRYYIERYKSGFIPKTARESTIFMALSKLRAPVVDTELRIEFTAGGVAYVSIEKARAAVEAARLASAPVAGEATRRGKFLPEHVTQQMIWNVQAVIEGECGGLSLDERQARNVMSFLMSEHGPDAAPQASEAVDRSPNLQGKPVDRSAELQGGASEAVRPDADAIDLARAGMDLHSPGMPEHTVCTELVRLAAALSAQPGAQKEGGNA